MALSFLSLLAKTAILLESLLGTSPLSLSFFFGFVKQVTLGLLARVLGTEGTWVLVFSGEGECWIHGLWWPKSEALSILEVMARIPSLTCSLCALMQSEKPTD